jgi:hypothetical protein
MGRGGKEYNGRGGEVERMVGEGRFEKEDGRGREVRRRMEGGGDIRRKKEGGW